MNTSCWWWVAVFSVVSLSSYSYFSREKKQALRELAFRLGEVEKERRSALEEREELQLQIASQTDPGWIELVLMRELGVVPEGWLKVHFKREHDEKVALK